MELQDRDRIHDVVADVGKPQINFRVVALILELNDLADHGRTHERYTAEAQENFVGLNVGQAIGKLVRNLANPRFVDDLHVGEVDHEDVIFKFKLHGVSPSILMTLSVWLAGELALRQSRQPRRAKSREGEVAIIPTGRPGERDRADESSRKSSDPSGERRSTRLFPNRSTYQPTRLTWELVPAAATTKRITPFPWLADLLLASRVVRRYHHFLSLPAFNPVSPPHRRLTLTRLATPASVVAEPPTASLDFSTPFYTT